MSIGQESVGRGRILNGRVLHVKVDKNGLVLKGLVIEIYKQDRKTKQKDKLLRLLFIRPWGEGQEKSTLKERSRKI